MSFVGYIRRQTLEIITGGDRRAIRDLEDQARAVKDSADALEEQGATTLRMKDAKVLTLSSNAEFQNERVVVAGDGIALREDGSNLIVEVGANGVSTEGGFSCRFLVEADTLLGLPLEGILATRSNTETLSRKTLSAPKITDLGDHSDDADAASGGVPVGGIYRDGSTLKVRVT